MPAAEPTTPEVGALAMDTRTDRVGIVMAKEGGLFQLRPLRGGLEWDVPPGLLRPVVAEGPSPSARPAT